MDIDWSPFAEIVDRHERFVLSSHVRPDADALGSELALAEMLDARGKAVRIVNPSATPETLDFLDPERRAQKIGEDVPAEVVLDTDVHVVLDTSAWGQLVGVGDVLKKSRAEKVVIDHHVSSDDLGAVEFKDKTADSTGSLIVRMADALGWEIEATAATALFCAIATDTGWFRFPSTTSDTLRRAARLIDAGAEPHLLYRELYERVSWAKLKLKGRVLERVQVECDGRLAYTSVRWDDFVETGARPVDTEELVNDCLRISGTQCAFIAVEQQNRQIKASLRSRSDVDVSAIAEKFDGGGHRKAAGAMLAGPLKDAVRRLRRAFVDAIEEQPATAVSE